MLRTTLRFHFDRDRNRSELRATEGRSELDQAPGTYLDTLDLRDAIIGDEVVLQEPGDHEFVLHQVVDCRVHELGRFQGTIGAWQALDALDDARAGRRF